MRPRASRQPEANPWAEPDPTPPGWRKVAVLFAVAVAAVIALAAVTSAATYASYGTPAWWNNPGRLHWCGRDYGRTPDSIDRRDIPSIAIVGDRPYPVRRIGGLPVLIGRPILASVTPASARNRYSPPVPCAMIIYLQSWSGRYVPYVLEGGP